METRCRVLRRPRRKLCYFTNNESQSKQWAEKLSLGNIDGMFDGLGELDSSPNNDLSPPSPLQAIDTETNQSEISPVPKEGQLTIKPQGPRRHVLQSARRSLAPELDIVEELKIPFEVHGLVKTSSPIEEKIVVEAVGEDDNERALVVPQILIFEEPKTDLLNIPIPQVKIHVTEESRNVDSELESPPSKITLSKPTMSSHKKHVAKSRKESPPTQNNTPKKSQSPVLVVERKTKRQEYTETSVSAVRQEPEPPSPEKNLSFGRQPSAKISTCGGKDINAFLQKVGDAERIKPGCSREFQPLVKVSTSPPELEDEFLILEDDTPLIYISCKTSSKRRQRQKETKVEHSSTDKNCSANEGTKDSPIETAHGTRELERKNPKWGIKSVNKIMKKNKGKDKRKEVTGHGYKDKCPILEDFTTGHFLEKGKPNKRKQDKNLTKSPKEVKSSKPLKDGKENAQVKNIETMDSHYISEKEINGSSAEIGKALVVGQVNQKTVPVVSAGRSSEVLGKRKRKQPGQWWLSCPQSTEETKVTDNQTPKKSKQNNKVYSAGKKDTVLKRRNQKRPAPESHDQTNRSEEKTKTSTKRIMRGETPDERKVTDDVFNANEVEQIEDQDVQHDVPDQDLEQGGLSPLVLAEGDLSSDKRRRKPPGDWWLVNDLEHTSSQFQKLHSKETKSYKERKNLSKQSRSSILGIPKNGNMAVSSKPLGGTSAPSLKLKPLSAQKTLKHSLATFKDVFTSATETEAEMCNRDTAQNNRYNVHAQSAEEACFFLQNYDTPPDSKCQSENTLKELKSGPSSMILLEQYEDEDLFLPASRAHATLSMSDLCAPPLKPLVLQPKDKANLRKWFKSLWPSVHPNCVEITPNEFDWYFYQDRAIGFLLDSTCGTASIGRILFGSYMKKPLWVDHSATTVFNLLTSSVKIVINGRESRFHAGQCFTVQCGHAYSIQNITSQPAVLYFTRILASD